MCEVGNERVFVRPVNPDSLEDTDLSKAAQIPRSANLVDVVSSATDRIPLVLNYHPFN